MLRQKILHALKLFFEQIDTIIALLLGAICSFLGLIGIAPAFILASATLGVLTIMAFALIRDRSQREYLQNSLNQLMATHNGPELDAIYNKSADDAPIIADAEQE